MATEILDLQCSGAVGELKELECREALRCISGGTCVNFLIRQCPGLAESSPGQDLGIYSVGLWGMRVWTAWEKCGSSLLFWVMSDCSAMTGKVTVILIFLRYEIWLLVFQ